MTVRLLTRLTLALALAAGAVFAQQSAPDVAFEARLKRLEADLRCLVCQNQTLADSNAPLAEDLRREVRTLALSGKSDAEIRTFLVARYGDFVLYQPPVKATTLLLWAGPALLLFAGFFFLIRNLRRRAVIEPALTAEEQARAARLLAGDNGKIDQ